jgi:hypothetical protein
VAKKASELVLERNLFYYKYTKQLNMVNLLSALILCLLIGFYIYYTSTVSERPAYFPTTPAGLVIYNPPLSLNHLSLEQQSQFVDPKTDYIIGMPEPRITFTKLQQAGDDALIIYWVSLALKGLFDYDYVHYRHSIQNMRKYFSNNGYNDFMQALFNSRSLLAVKARGAVVIPKIVQGPKITQVKLVADRVVWDIEAMVELTYDSLTEQPLVQRMKAMLTIARFPTYVSPFYGLAIVRSNFSDYDGEQP